MKSNALLITLLILCSCSNTNRKNAPIDSAKSVIAVKKLSSTDSIALFEQKMYLTIDEMHTGKVYTNKNNIEAFYRLIVVPSEENITLYAENISVGEEGGNFKLVKLLRLTDDNSALPKFGLYSIDSLKFTDSVTIEGYFNKKKKAFTLIS